MLVNGAVVVAAQISAVPAWALARCTSVHVRPAPDTVTDCLGDEGPSEATKATKSSFAFAVENGGVVIVPLPSTKTIGAIAGPTVTVAGCEPARISTAAKFHWSVVGAVSASCTAVPAAATVPSRNCAQ